MSAKIKFSLLSIPGIQAVLIFLALLSSWPNLTAAPAGTAAISGGTLIDGSGGAPLENALILIRDGRINQISRVGEMEIPADSQVIDARGKTVLPGFIDGHVHFRSWHGELYLAHGVTTVVDLGNDDEWMIALMRAREQGLIRTPRIFASGARFGAKPGQRHPDSFRRVDAFKPHFLFVEVEEAKQMIQEKKRNGMIVIKVDETWKGDDLRQIVEAAHSLGLPVVGHATDPRDAARAGQDCLIHNYSMVLGVIGDPAKREALYRGEIDDLNAIMDPATFPDLIDVLVSNNTCLNFTPSYWPFKGRDTFLREDLELLSRPELAYVPFDARVNITRFHHQILARPESAVRSLREHYQRFLREFAEAGGRIIVGTDTVNFVMPGAGLRRDLMGLRESGIAPMKVIQAATKNPAELYHLEELGTLEPGKWADLQIVNGDPLQDLEALKQIELLMIAGEEVDRSFHSDYHTLFERPYPEDAGRGRPPEVRAIEPKAAVQGSPEINLTVSGVRFDQFTTVLFGGVRLPTDLVDSGKLKAQIPRRLMGRPGTFRVSVDDPRLLGQPSRYWGFVVHLKPR